MNKSKKICPNCRRESIPRIKVHEVQGSNKIVVEEFCGYCRIIMAQRESTNELERIRKDVLALTNRVNSGDQHLEDVLNARITRYNILLREFQAR